MKHSKSSRTKQDLTPKQKRFVLEYMVDFNSTRAATAAGYKQPNVIGCQLLNHPIVSKQIALAQKKAEEKIEITKEMVIEQLRYLLTRDAGEYFDDRGVVLPIKKMSKKARATLDGFKQKIIGYTEDGLPLVETEVKFSGKATAVDMSMKHKGLIAVTKSQVDVNAKLDLSALVGRSKNPAAEIEGKIVDVVAEDVDAIEGE